MHAEGTSTVSVRTITDLVTRLAGRPAVAGLVRYGGRPAAAPASACGDFDLFVLVDARPPELESIHFDVGGIPVDLNVRTWPDLERAARGEPMRPVAADFRLPACAVASTGGR